ncbi:M56 family metallopeptidase [Saccharopolyspora indica]|uniref:M56 family metallopeptidase n=1 Tax=Saccharopolyspora indica TaxID=1229659 RepID=UPI0022EA3D40|nr:M56 family metallopeptidase [Saccharopolyspora indica]MDA3642553.1 M56 family metallopeptidase [Saccharopolyspora indica]
MILAVALLLGVAFVAGFGPAVLNRMLQRRMDPQLVLMTWGGLVATTFVTVTAALTITVLPTHGPAPLLVQLLHHCWTALQHGSAPQLHLAAGLLLLTAIAGLSSRVSIGLLRHARRQRREHRRHLDLLRIAARPESGAFPIMWLPHPEPMAYSVAGAPGFVVATDGVRDRLGPDAAAVLEHERAHLRGRHHLLVGLAEALSRSAPWLPLMRRSPELVRTAVELAADRSAAHLHGPGAVRSALLHMSGGRGGGSMPAHALGMADSAVALRLHHLSDLPSAPGKAKRALTSGMAGLTAATLPTLAGIALLPVLAMITCPFAFGF